MFSQTSDKTTCHPSLQHSFLRPFDLYVSEHPRPPIIEFTDWDRQSKEGLFCYPGCLVALEGSIREWFQEVWHYLTRLFQDAHQIFLWRRDVISKTFSNSNNLCLGGHLYLAIICPVNEGEGSAIISNPACSSDPTGNLVDPILKYLPPEISTCEHTPQSRRACRS